jgi:hypothetical protein
MKPLLKKAWSKPKMKILLVLNTQHGYGASGDGSAPTGTAS